MNLIPILAIGGLAAAGLALIVVGANELRLRRQAQPRGLPIALICIGGVMLLTGVAIFGWGPFTSTPADPPTAEVVTEAPPEPPVEPSTAEVVTEAPPEPPPGGGEQPPPSGLTPIPGNPTNPPPDITIVPVTDAPPPPTDTPTLAPPTATATPAPLPSPFNIILVASNESACGFGGFQAPYTVTIQGTTMTLFQVNAGITSSGSYDPATGAFSTSVGGLPGTEIYSGTISFDGATITMSGTYTYDGPQGCDGLWAIFGQATP